MTLIDFLNGLPARIDAKATASVDVRALATSSMNALVAAAPNAHVPQYIMAREQLALAGSRPLVDNPHTMKGVVGKALHDACISCVAAEALSGQAVADLLAPMWA